MHTNKPKFCQFEICNSSRKMCFRQHWKMLPEFAQLNTTTVATVALYYKICVAHPNEKQWQCPLLAKPFSSNLPKWLFVDNRPLERLCYILWQLFSNSAFYNEMAPWSMEAHPLINFRQISIYFDEIFLNWVFSRTLKFLWLEVCISNSRDENSREFWFFKFSRIPGKSRISRIFLT
jgi:hypothetical protein